MIIERGLSLTQPWATLMASGAKRIETRSWRTNYRGWIAIHAAKGFPSNCKTLCLTEPFASALLSAGVEDLNDLPLGRVIAVTCITDCRPTESFRNISERAFGDYTSGRYGFVCGYPLKLREPIPMKGALGIWRLVRPIRREDLA
ncbi:MAG: ASCH domain-containing protein [Betaproteobacteria bacterium]|nr:MAG: ASCH domain-containing protein [Betaproteobacteria bacterium]